MGGAEAQGEVSDWSKRDASAQPAAAEPRAAHQTDRWQQGEILTFDPCNLSLSKKSNCYVLVCKDVLLFQKKQVSYVSSLGLRSRQMHFPTKK